MKAKKGLITIQCNGGLLKVHGFVFGEWGYHLSVPVFFPEKHWTVTHIPSGLCVAENIATMKWARELAMRLEEELPACHGSSSEEIPDDFKDKVFKIVREVLDR